MRAPHFQIHNAYQTTPEAGVEVPYPGAETVGCYVTINAANGQVLFTSEIYSGEDAKRSARNAIDIVRQTGFLTSITDHTLPKPERSKQAPKPAARKKGA